MKDVIGSTRFWVSIVVCICVTVLAGLKIISGDLACGIMGGLVGGFGVGKTWTTNAAAASAAAAAAVVAVADEKAGSKTPAEPPAGGPQ